MTYNKRILYMDFYEDGMKQANAGFVKLTQWRRNSSASDGERTCLQIYVSRFPLKEETEGTVKIINNSHEILLGQVKIVDGKGMMQVGDLEGELEKANMTDNQEEILLRVEFAPRGYLECVMRHAEESDRQEVSLEAAEVMETETDNSEESAAEPENRLTDGEETGLEELKKTPDVVTGKMLRMRHDKWQQLEDVFTHIRPFEDEREYLQMELKDMVVLSNMYYRLAENSFLLHGYYNYGHLILTKVYKRGGEKIYIGVPGNYYEKEAQVAVMFGFESFEPKSEPARDGDFGYYMIAAGI